MVIRFGGDGISSRTLHYRCGVFVVVLLAGALAAIWRGVRGDEIKKIEPKQERGQAANTH
jgi:hypothetical protein